MGVVSSLLETTPQEGGLEGREKAVDGKGDFFMTMMIYYFK